MSLKYSLPFSLSLLVAACASNPDRKDWSLQSQDESAILTIIGEDGKSSDPFHGEYFSMPGYIFSGGAIIFHPGKRRITYSCPGNWEWKIVTHFIPWLDYTFEAGGKYELHCVDGYPNIRPVN